ncbi:pickpocket protein 28-like [Culicoides brevitarsis]|uniref:pickpocket protein 28-like n=1 Tax=Culicoides brevitarsis TaxID=469753 RepID=UPI00307C61A3
MDTDGRKRVVAKKVFHEYCDSSTIHGLKYLGTRPLHEKEFNYDENFPPTAANWSFEMDSIKPENPNFVFTNPFYPFRVFTTGQQLIVYLASNVADDFDSYCPGYGGTFRVYLHAPNELPWYSHQYHDINIKTYTTLSVEPHVVMATERMRTSYGPERRKCYFDGEKRLKYFKHYTKRNCELECLINITQAICNCSRFNFPRDLGVNICGLRDYECMTRTATFYLNVESASATLNVTKAYQGRFKCNCWASCRSVRYTAEKREEKLFHNQHKHVQVKKTGENGSVKITEVNYEMTKLYVTFKDSEFFALKRSELYGLTDFVANCGGLLGLFMGVSLLSLVEIIYFLTVRFFMGIFNRHKKIKNSETD